MPTFGQGRLLFGWENWLRIGDRRSPGLLLRTAPEHMPETAHAAAASQAEDDRIALGRDDARGVDAAETTAAVIIQAVLPVFNVGASAA